jgi:hypothetical protein
VTAKPHHLFTYITTIREVSYFLGQPYRIDLNQLSTAIQQFSDALLQPQAISIGEPGGGAFDNRNE